MPIAGCCSRTGFPRDFVFLDINPAFGTLTGLRDVVGKRACEIIPGFREDNPEIFEIYDRVAMTGATERFETYVEALGFWFSVSVYSPAPGAFRRRFRQYHRAQEGRDSAAR